jgi:hypothetical protein
MLQSTVTVVRIVIISGVIAGALLYLFPAVFHVRPVY